MNPKPREGKSQREITWLVSNQSCIDNTVHLTLNPELLNLSWVMGYFENTMKALDSFS